MSVKQSCQCLSSKVIYCLSYAIITESLTRAIWIANTFPSQPIWPTFTSQMQSCQKGRVEQTKGLTHLLRHIHGLAHRPATGDKLKLRAIGPLAKAQKLMIV